VVGKRFGPQLGWAQSALAYTEQGWSMGDFDMKIALLIVK